MIDIDWDVLKFLWTAGTGVLGLIAAIAVLWLKSKFTPKDMFDSHVARSQDVEKAQNQRITVVEQALIHSPKKEDIAILSEQLAALGREIAELRGEQGAQNKLLDAIHDHLLNKKG